MLKIHDWLKAGLCISTIMATVFYVANTLESQTVRPRVEAPPARVIIAVAPGAVGSAQTQITYTVQDPNLNPLPFINFYVYVSDSANCNGVTATVSSSTVGIIGGVGVFTAATTTSGAASITTSALLQTQGGSTITMMPVMASNAGTLTLGITDSAKTTWFPCALFPAQRFRIVGTQLVTANFGSIMLPYNIVGKWEDGIWKKFSQWIRQLINMYQSDAAFLEKVEIGGKL